MLNGNSRICKATPCGTAAAGRAIDVIDSKKDAASKMMMRYAVGANRQKPPARPCAHDLDREDVQGVSSWD